MSVIHWVRHGPTGSKALIGHTDLAADLSDAGAIARLSAALPRAAPVGSSDLLRARATADAVAGDRPRLTPDPDLREIGFGEWEGLTHDAVPDQALARRFWDEPGAVAPPGGESWDVLRARVDPAVARLLARGHPEVVVVAHLGVILTQLQRALGVGAREVFAHHLEPLSVTRLRLSGGAWRAEAVGWRP